MDHNKFDVIVVGAGIMGSCAAYNTSRRGRKTLLLEQFDFLHHRGSSHGESRTIRATYAKTQYCEMAIEAARLWEEAQSDIGYRVYFPTRQLDVGPAADPSLSSVIQSCRSSGLSHRVLPSDQVAEEFSGRLALPEDWVAVVSDLGGVIKPTKAVAMFQSLALKSGAVLRDNVKVTGIQKRDGGITVSSADGSVFRGKKCVLSVGVWMRKLVKDLTGEEIPIQPLETSVMYWKVKEGHEGDFSIEGGFPTFSSYGYPQLYGTPALEFPGLIKVALHAGWPCDPGNRTWTPLSGSEDKIGEWIRESFAGLVEAEKPAMVQSCMYSMTPDEGYVIDFLGGQFEKDVVIAGGFSGHGFKMGPVIGRILADMVTNRSLEGVDLKYFKLDRFKGNANKFGE